MNLFKKPRTEYFQFYIFMEGIYQGTNTAQCPTWAFQAETLAILDHRDFLKVFCLLSRPFANGATYCGLAYDLLAFILWIFLSFNGLRWLSKFQGNFSIEFELNCIKRQKILLIACTITLFQLKVSVIFKRAYYREVSSI